VFILLLALFLSGMYSNWAIFFRGIFKRKHESWIPLVFGAIGVLCFLISPIDGMRPFWWAPLIVDWGSAPGIGHALIYHVYWRVRAKDTERN
jgi:hypothetical protein